MTSHTECVLNVPVPGFVLASTLPFSCVTCKVHVRADPGCANGHKSYTERSKHQQLPLSNDLFIL